MSALDQDVHAAILPTEDPRWWWACSVPERPSDDWTLFSDECDACLLALVAGIRVGTVPLVSRFEDGRWVGFGIEGIVEYRRSAGLDVPDWLLVHAEQEVER